MVLNKLYKHCEIDFHLFTELLKSFQRNFPDYYLFVPSLQGYELAREIKRFLGSPQVVCIYLKGDCGERFLEGEGLKDVTFENILEDTKKHYEERGGIEKKKKELGGGLEISMFYRTNDVEEEILWMQIRIALSPLII